MSKILLVSLLHSAAHLLKRVDPELKKKTVTYIPTACNKEKLKFIYKLRIWSIRSIGWEVDELDIATASYEVIKAKLEKNDVIFVAGGNTFYLMQEMKRTGADKLIINEVKKGKFYVGESAGAIVAGPNIEYASLMDSKQTAPDLSDYSGLGLVDFYVVVHAHSLSLNKAVKAIINTYSSILDLRVIRNNQAIFVNDKNIELLE